MMNQFADTVIKVAYAMPLLISVAVASILIYNIPFVKNWFKNISN